jgi:hypothetical protein
MTTTDLAIHHFIKIRLTDASAGDTKAVMNQLGVQAGKFEGEPDITVRFVPKLELKSPLRHMVMGEAGFTDEMFIAVEGDHKASISLDQIGHQCEIVCESGASSVPQLVSVVNLTALSKGIMPIHASAFQFKGIGVLASGWPKGGKTSSLFAFLSKGAQFVSDDWLYVDHDGKVYPLLQPIKLHDWQLEHLPEFRSRISSGKLRKMKLVKAADSLERKLPESLREGFAPTQAYHLVMRYLNKKQRHVYISPAKLFGDQATASAAPFEKLFLTLSHESQDIVVREMQLDAALDKLVFSLMYEWQEFIAYYIQFRYAFPGRANPVIDELEKRQRELLATILTGKSIYMVHHPHPVPLDALYNALAPYVTSGA